MKYRSKPHTIESFQFTLENMKRATIPDWFEKALETNVAQMTINGKDQYVSLYSPDGGVRKAFLDDWICFTRAENILFPLTNESFKKDFELDV